jgi:tRNA uridine 5-carboxymethylaminomethyl modification enzyme
LRLRADNAEARLTPKAIDAGCVTSARAAHFGALQAERAGIEKHLGQSFSGAELQRHSIRVRDDGVRRPLSDWLRYPEPDRASLLRVVPSLAEYRPILVDEAIEDHRYAPYLERQAAEVARLRTDDAVRLPASLDYGSIPGLSNEMIERLALVRPTTLGAARRVRGVTPAALAAILVHARKKAA